MILNCKTSFNFCLVFLYTGLFLGSCTWKSAEKNQHYKPLEKSVKRGVVYWSKEEVPDSYVQWRCTFIDNSGKIIFNRPYKYCHLLPKKKQIISIASNQLSLMDYVGNKIWSKPLQEHHHFFSDNESEVVFALMRRKKKFNGQDIWHDGIEGYNLRGELVYSWYADKYYDDIENIKSIDGSLKDSYHLDSINSFNDLADTLIGIKINSLAVLRNHPLKDQLPAFSDGNILISFYEYGAIAIIDKTSKKIVWSHIISRFKEQKGVHSLRVLPNGNFLYFQNRATEIVVNKESQWFPQVVELNPAGKKIVWNYPKDALDTFYSPSNCSAYMYNNKTIMISYTQNKSVVEVNRQGIVLWEWHPDFTKELESLKNAKLKGVKRVSKETLNPFL